MDITLKKLKWCAVCGRFVKAIFKKNDYYCPNCQTQTPTDKIKQVFQGIPCKGNDF